jgi:2-keto-4-pentenoate hydratase
MTLITTPLREAADRFIAAAYAVQRLLTEDSLARGRRIVGQKIGLTSAAVHQQLGVDQPDSGVLFADMRVATGATVPTHTLLQPKVEAEIAFILADDLDGDLSASRLRAATGVAEPAIEIVDSRVRDWSISIVDTIADNGSSALFVLGSEVVAAADLDFASRTMRLTRDGVAVSTGQGSDCLGSPLNALRWLARTARENGSPLRRPHRALRCAGPMVPVRPGSTYAAEIDGIGSIDVSFAEVTR